MTNTIYMVNEANIAINNFFALSIEYVFFILNTGNYINVVDYRYENK